MHDLVLGSRAHALTVRLTRGDRCDFALRSLAEDKVTPKPWSHAPDMVFDSGIEWAASLSEGGSLATWNRGAADVAAVLRSSDRGVRIRVNGVTKWRGVVKVYD